MCIDFQFVGVACLWKWRRHQLTSNKIKVEWVNLSDNNQTETQEYFKRAMNKMENVLKF